MSQLEQLHRRAGAMAHGAASEARPWIQPLARAGYAARGFLYGTVGVLAGLAAAGRGGKTTDSKGALRTLHEAPFGKVVLVALTIGLVGFAVWRFVQAVLDPENIGSEKKGLAKRAGYFGSGLVHTALTVYTLGLVTGGALGSADDGGASWTERLMSWPGGPWLVGAAGLVVLVFAATQLVKAYRADLDEHLDFSRMPGRARSWAVGVGRFGIGARGASFALIGAGVVMAAINARPSEAKGLGEALSSLRSMPAGWALLGVVALGLLAFGVYQGLEARYRRIRVA